MVAGAAWIADALLVLFVWAILALAFWRVFQRTGEKATWLNWLGRSVTIGAIGCVIGSLAFAGSMVEQYVVGEEGDPHALTSRVRAVRLELLGQAAIVHAGCHRPFLEAKSSFLVDRLGHGLSLD